MKCKCIKEMAVEKLMDPEDLEPIGLMTIEKESIWELTERTSDWEVFLENEDGEWLGLSLKDFSENFESFSEVAE